MNGCYGDALDPAEVIVQRETLLRIMAAERNVAPHDFDDTVQEGRIALWEVAVARPDASAAYLNAAARTRITEFVTRGKATGQPSQQGKASVDPLRRQDRDSLDDDPNIAAVAVDVLDGVELAYHEGEIMSAIAALPELQRKYVVLRFWGGMTNAEIAAKLGTPAPRLDRVWRDITKPRLARRLHRLASVV